MIISTYATLSPHWLRAGTRAVPGLPLVGWEALIITYIREVTMVICSSLSTNTNIVSGGKTTPVGSVQPEFSVFVSNENYRGNRGGNNCNRSHYCLSTLHPLHCGHYKTTDYTPPRTTHHAPQCLLLSPYKWTLKSCMRIAGNELQP